MFLSAYLLCYSSAITCYPIWNLTKLIAHFGHRHTPSFTCWYMGSFLLFACYVPVVCESDDICQCCSLKRLFCRISFLEFCYLMRLINNKSSRRTIKFSWGDSSLNKSRQTIFLKLSLNVPFQAMFRKIQYKDKSPCYDRPMLYPINHARYLIGPRKSHTWKNLIGKKSRALEHMEQCII